MFRHILTCSDTFWHDRACQMWQGHSHHAPLYRHKQDAQVCSHCPLPGVLKTDERAAWPPTPPGGQVMTSLRPNLFGFNFFFDFFRFFLPARGRHWRVHWSLSWLGNFDKVCEIHKWCLFSTQQFVFSVQIYSWVLIMIGYCGTIEPYDSHHCVLCIALSWILSWILHNI